MTRRGYSEHVDIPQVPPDTENMLPPTKGGLRPERSALNKEPGPRTPEQSNAIRRGRAARRRWEESPEGQARTQDISDLMDTAMKPAQVYMARGWDTQGDPGGPKVYDTQLPGMEDPLAAPRPPKWEELTPETRMHAERKLAEFGTDINTMTSDFGAQLDQAHHRMETEGWDEPAARDFYNRKGLPRQIVEGSAEELGTSLQIHTHMNALTSPNTKFAQDVVEDGVVTDVKFPNNETAMGAAGQAIAGVAPEDASMDNPMTGKRYQGRPANMARAVRGLGQHLQDDTPPAEWRNAPSKSNPEGTVMWGEKTGPYSNSMGSDSTPQYFVSDVHSGGGGMVPHLGTDKPIRFNDSGEIVVSKSGAVQRDKSGREQAIEAVPHFHAVADYAARQAMAQRGLGHVREAQATQWGEEINQRTEAGLRGASILTQKPESAWRSPDTGSRGQNRIKGQQEMFPNE